MSPAPSPPLWAKSVPPSGLDSTALGPSGVSFCVPVSPLQTLHRCCMGVGQPWASGLVEEGAIVEDGRVGTRLLWEQIHKLHLFDSGVQLSGSSESDQGQYLTLLTLLSDLGCRLTAMRPSVTTGHPSVLDGQSQSHVRLGPIHAASITPSHSDPWTGHFSPVK